MVQQSVVRVAEAEGAFHGADAITVPSTAVRAYLRTFGAVAIVAYADGTVGCTKDIGRPLRSKPVAVWWAPNAALAIEVVRQCEAEHNTDITGVAYGLGVRLTPNNVAIANAERAVACLDDRMAQAQNAGLLKTLNTRYRQARMAARQRGQSFPPYQIVHRRFTQLLYRIAAGEVPTRSLVEEALDAPHEATQPRSAVRW
jgi:hypothetical protein